MLSNFEEKVSEKLESFERKIRNSFAIIKNDFGVMNSKLDSMREFMNEWDAKITETWGKDEVTKNEIESKSKEFSEKISKARDVLSELNSIKKEILVKADLEKIEEDIRVSLRREIENYKDEIISLRAALTSLNERIDDIEKRRFRKERKEMEVKKLGEDKKERKTWKFSSNFKNF